MKITVESKFTGKTEPGKTYKSIIDEERKISIMINSPNFDFFNFFILKDGCIYRLFGERIPGKTIPVGRKSYQSKKAALIAAGKLATPGAVIKGNKPIWSHFYNPEKKWLEKKTSL